MAKGFRAEERALAHVSKMDAYVPGMQPEGADWTKLNTNECPYPPSSRVAEAIQGGLESLAKYPNPRSGPLRKGIGEFYGIGEERVIVGNGSDDILNLLIRAFCGDGKSGGMTLPSYSLYSVLGAIQGVELIRIPFDESFTLPVDAIANSGANLFFLTSPNAPTGVGFSNCRIRELLEKFSGLLVVDEAYGAFAEESAVSLLQDFDNLLITRTFSKSHGLAGLRVGYGMGSQAVIELLDRVRDSYNVNHLSQLGALAALKDEAYYDDIVRRVIRTRNNFVERFRGLGWFTFDSQANFVFTEPVGPSGVVGAEIAESLYEFLKSERVLVRYFGSDEFTSRFLRISIGTESQMEKLMETISKWQKNA